MFDVTTLSLPLEDKFANYQIDNMYKSDNKSPLEIKIDSKWISEEFGFANFYNYDLSLRLRAGYGRRSDSFIRKIYPILKSGRFIIRPRPMIQVIASNEVGYSIKWADAENTNDDSWRYLSAEPVDRPVPISTDRKVYNEETLMEISMPFIRGIPFLDYAKILDDEDHLISSVRVALKNAAKEAQASGAHATEIRNDLLRPNIDRLDKKLRDLKSKHAIARFADIGGVTMSLVPALASGMVSVVLGASGVGFGRVTLRELRRKSERRELENDPSYLLWRLKSAAQ